MSKLSKFGLRCPICKTEWKVTSFNTKEWYDCVKCNDTAENLLKKANEMDEEPKGHRERYSTSSELGEFMPEYLDPYLFWD